MKLLILMAVALSAFAADVTGKWTAAVPGRDGEMQVVYTFAVEAGKVTGTAVSQLGDYKIEDVKIEGDSIKFSVQTAEFKAVHSGTIVGNEIKLKVDVGERVVEFIAKKSS